MTYEDAQRLLVHAAQLRPSASIEDDDLDGLSPAQAAQRNYLQALHFEVAEKGVYVGMLYVMSDQARKPIPIRIRITPTIWPCRCAPPPALEHSGGTWFDP